MKKKQFRKPFIVFLLLVIMMNMSVFATTNDNVTVTGVVDTTATINTGDIFIYKLTVQNDTGGALDFSASISGDFTVADSNTLNFGTINDGSSMTKSIPLEYTGNSDQLNVLVVDTTGANTVLHTETVTNARSTSNSSPSDNVNTNKYFPEFRLNFSTDTPVFNAGQTKIFSFDIENITTYAAKGVIVSFDTGSDSPFYDLTNPLVSSKLSIQGKEKETINFRIKTKESTKSGFYTIPVTIRSQNVYGVEKTQTKDLQIEVVNKNILPSVVISNMKIKNTILIPGQEDVVLLELRNLGTLDIKNINLTLEGLSMEGITLNADAANKQITKISAKGTDFVTYNFNISDKLTKDEIELSLKLDYHDQNGGQYTQTLPVYLDVAQSGSDIYDYGFEVTSQPSTVLPGQEFKIKYDFTNNSEVIQKDLKLTISSDGNFVFKSQPIIIVKEMAPGETKSFEYSLIADKNMASNNYPTYIAIESLKNSDVTRKEYLGIFVDGEGSKNSKPKIIIDNYDFGKDVILAGETFDLDMTFFNTSNSMGIQNAKVSISSDEGAFVPVNASSSFYVETIGIKEKVTHTMTFKAKADLNVKTYSITADIEYEDSNGNSYDISENPYKATEKMSIPVMQELRLEVEDITIPEFSPLYQPIEIYVEFFNMGKSSLENMMVTTEGEFEIQDGKYFVGSFNAGSNEYYSATIIPVVEGPQEGSITFEFEDAVGEKHSVEKGFAFEAFPMEQPEEMYPPDGFEGGGEYPMDGEVKGGFPWVTVLIILVVVGIVVIIVVKRKIRKKKEMALDE